MKKLLSLIMVIVGVMSMNLEAGWRRHSPKRQVTVQTQVSVRVPVKRVRPVRVVRVVERVVPARTVRVIEYATPVRRVCYPRPCFNVGFGFGGPRAGFGFGFGF